MNVQTVFRLFQQLGINDKRIVLYDDGSGVVKGTILPHHYDDIIHWTGLEDATRKLVKYLHGESSLVLWVEDSDESFFFVDESPEEYLITNNIDYDWQYNILVIQISKDRHQENL